MTDMEPVSMLFLQALRASLEDRTVDWETDIERETWDALFAMAASHSVLPMIYAAVVRCPAARKAGNGLLRTVFPPARQLAGRYPYLKEKPYLLPLAWVNRILKYGKETAGGSADNNAAQSIKIGNGRVALLKEYGIIGSGREQNENRIKKALTVFSWSRLSFLPYFWGNCRGLAYFRKMK